MDTGIQAAALIVIVSFAIDRICGAVFFLLSVFDVWGAKAMEGDAAVSTEEARAAQQRTKLAYFTLAGVLAAIVVFTLRISMLEALHVGEDMQHTWLDALFGILVLMCGSDQVATLLKSPHAGKALDTPAAKKPLEVTGTLTLVEHAGRRETRD